MNKYLYFTQMILCICCSGTSPIARAEAGETDLSISVATDSEPSALYDDIDMGESEKHPAETSPNISAKLPEIPNEQPPNDTRTITFQWCPKNSVADAYEMAEPQDQHRIVLTPGVEEGGSYPVVVAFHGQPSRKKNPRDYAFQGIVSDLVVKMVTDKEISPVILVIPVFRFTGGNWPWFNPAKFKKEVEARLKENGIAASKWFAFGHSGAAGCGGGGLNQAHLMKPEAVGFFDTCLGKGWRDEIAALGKAKIRTVNIHSVETAGFEPRQRPEYQADFDFGLAYEPVGMVPIKCPEKHPGKNLRKIKYRCASTQDKMINGFVIDTGEGLEAHQAVLEPAIRYFLSEFSAP